MDFKIELAEIPIQVHSQYDSLKEYCKDYVVKEPEKRTGDAAADTPQMMKDHRQAEECSENGLEIVITQDDIERERENSREEGQQESAGAQYSPQYLETLVLLRKIAEELPDRDMFLMHGAVISWKGNAYMFTAPSGTGKSTHISLWRKYLGEGVQSINGDKPFLSVSDTEVRAYGTPWAGKERWQHNTSAPLKGICILSQAKENKIRKLTPGESLNYLLRQIHFTTTPEKAAHTLDLLDKLLTQIPVWYLECDISKEAMMLSFEALTGGDGEKW